MPEEKLELRKINWRETFAWTELFRGFRLALDLKKLLLAAAGVALVFAGSWVLAQVWGRNGLLADSPWARGPVLSPLVAIEPAAYLLEAARGLIRPADTQQFFFGLTTLIWLILVWTLFAGAITRIAAVQLARDEKIGLKEALKFALKKYPSYLGAPIFPIVGILFFVLLCVIGGLVGWIPYAGEILAGLLWFLPLIAGFVMLIIAIGLAVGWPLMYATISAEGSDSFDAISRSYSYIYQRPWRYAWYWLVAAVYGSIVIAFVAYFTFGMCYAAREAVGIVAPGKYALMHKYTPTAPIGELQVSLLDYPLSLGTEQSVCAALTEGPYAEPKGIENVGAVFVAFWVGLAFLLMLGFVHSYFWSASTIIYFLLRREVDATEMDEVYLEEQEEEEEELDLGPEPAAVAKPAEEAGAKPAEEPKPETGSTGEEKKE